VEVTSAEQPTDTPSDRTVWDRLRDLHKPIAGDGGPYCETCAQEEQQPLPVGWWVPFPCPTIQAVDEELRRLAAAPYPPHDSWLVQISLSDAEKGWHVTYPSTERDKAVERLERGRRESPEHQWRLIRMTDSYTLETE
jgi:hypothetical protein